MKRFKDGWYGVFPEGGQYEAVKVIDDEIDDSIQQSLAGEHRAGNPRYARIHDAIDAMANGAVGEMLFEKNHVKFVQMIDLDWDPYTVHVCYLGDI